MGSYDLDHVDRGILHHLQRDARGISTEAIGNDVGVAASTVRNRINGMEDAGVIVGYFPLIDYCEAGFPLHYQFLCRAPVGERARMAEQVQDVSGVVRVSEFVDSRFNVAVEAIATDADALAGVTERLDELGMTVERGAVYQRSHVQPFDHFDQADPEETQEM